VNRRGQTRNGAVRCSHDETDYDDEERGGRQPHPPSITDRRRETLSHLTHVGSSTPPWASVLTRERYCRSRRMLLRAVGVGSQPPRTAPGNARSGVSSRRRTAGAGSEVTAGSRTTAPKRCTAGHWPPRLLSVPEAQTPCWMVRRLPRMTPLRLRNVNVRDARPSPRSNIRAVSKADDFGRVARAS
jgi:hypothetical protein